MWGHTRSVVRDRKMWLSVLVIGLGVGLAVSLSVTHSWYADALRREYLDHLVFDLEVQVKSPDAEQYYVELTDYLQEHAAVERVYLTRYTVLGNVSVRVEDPGPNRQPGSARFANFSSLPVVGVDGTLLSDPRLAPLLIGNYTRYATSTRYHLVSDGLARDLAISLPNGTDPPPTRTDPLVTLTFFTLGDPGKNYTLQVNGTVEGDPEVSFPSGYAFSSGSLFVPQDSYAVVDRATLTVLKTQFSVVFERTLLQVIVNHPSDVRGWWSPPSPGAGLEAELSAFLWEHGLQPYQYNLDPYYNRLLAEVDATIDRLSLFAWLLALPLFGFVGAFVVVLRAQVLKERRADYEVIIARGGTPHGIAIALVTEATLQAALATPVALLVTTGIVPLYRALLAGPVLQSLTLTGWVALVGPTVAVALGLTALLLAILSVLVYRAQLKRIRKNHLITPRSAPFLARTNRSWPFLAGFFVASVAIVGYLVACNKNPRLGETVPTFSSLLLYAGILLSALNPVVGGYLLSKTVGKGLLTLASKRGHLTASRACLPALFTRQNRPYLELLVFVLLVPTSYLGTATCLDATRTVSASRLSYFEVGGEVKLDYYGILDENLEDALEAVARGAPLTRADVVFGGFRRAYVAWSPNPVLVGIEAVDPYQYEAVLNQSHWYEEQLRAGLQALAERPNETVLFETLHAAREGIQIGDTLSFQHPAHNAIVVFHVAGILSFPGLSGDQTGNVLFHQNASILAELSDATEASRTSLLASPELAAAEIVQQISAHYDISDPAFDITTQDHIQADLTDPLDPVGVYFKTLDIIVALAIVTFILALGFVLLILLVHQAAVRSFFALVNVRGVNKRMYFKYHAASFLLALLMSGILSLLSLYYALGFTATTTRLIGTSSQLAASLVTFHVPALQFALSLLGGTGLWAAVIIGILALLVSKQRLPGALSFLSREGGSI